MNLFPIHNRFCIHKATQSVIIAINECWINDVLHVDCFIPTDDNKGKIYLANATYSIDEIELI